MRHRIEVHPSVGEERLVHDELADAEPQCILLGRTERTGEYAGECIGDDLHVPLCEAACCRVQCREAQCREDELWTHGRDPIGFGVEADLCERVHRLYEIAPRRGCGQYEMGLRAAAQERRPPLFECCGERSAVCEHLLAVGTELRLCGGVQSKGERRKAVRVHGYVPRIGDGGIQLRRKLLSAEEDGTVGAAERVIGREGHYVGKRNGRGYETCRHETDALPDVHPEIGTYGACNGGEAFVVRDTRIADGGEYDEARLYALRDLCGFVPVHPLQGGINAVVLKVKLQPRTVLLLAHVEGEYGIAPLQQTEQGNT